MAPPFPNTPRIMARTGLALGEVVEGGEADDAVEGGVELVADEGQAPAQQLLLRIGLRAGMRGSSATSFLGPCTKKNRVKKLREIGFKKNIKAARKKCGGG